jgi:hypothetical protein
LKGGTDADAEDTPAALSGTVYETTDAGRQPVDGADISESSIVDLFTTKGSTDAQGHYHFCGLPNGMAGTGVPATLDLYLTKNGFDPADVAVTLSGPTTTFDVEMHRSMSGATSIRRPSRR